MAAYLIAEIDVKDSARYDAYRREVPRLIAKHGGEYLVRGGTVEVLEGDRRPRGRVVVLRFTSLHAIRNLFEDPEYRPLRALRNEVATSDILAVEGIEKE